MDCVSFKFAVVFVGIFYFIALLGDFDLFVFDLICY